MKPCKVGDGFVLAGFREEEWKARLEKGRMEHLKQKAKNGPLMLDE